MQESVHLARTATTLAPLLLAMVSNLELPGTKMLVIQLATEMICAARCREHEMG